MGKASYSYLREHLAEAWDKVEMTKEPMIVSRRGHKDIAILLAHELEAIRETAHLMRAPKNAQRLLAAIARAQSDSGRVAAPADSSEAEAP